MAYTALERIFSTERVQQRAARHGGFSVPALHERSVEATNAPFLASNMRGTFVRTRPSKQGFVRFGFSSVPVGDDDLLLAELFRSLLQCSTQEEWGNRCTDVKDAVARIQSYGMAPYAVTLSFDTLETVLPDVSLEDARTAMAQGSQVAEIEGVRVLVADLPSKTALVTALPVLTGVYIRTGDYVGVMAQKVDQTIILVTP